MGRRADTVSLSLRLIQETTCAVVGEDAEGDRRKFDKRDLLSCVVSRKLESVSVVIEKRKLKKIRMLRGDFSPMAEKAVVLKNRRCLNCRHPFKAHPSTFICTPCKKTVSWRMGGDYSLMA
jgi:hypothetical protein